ncbi:MAG: DUF5103 domain-containing protein [Bacteroidaceae bacterium]|nr:DUF5103 domain-containing protein [Bacteroidaceae bacterium]
MRFSYILNLLLIFLLEVATARAQYTRSLCEDIRTVRTIVNDNPLSPPIAKLNEGTIEVSFDQMSHSYMRYLYKVQFCNADWTVNEEVFESDYLEGFNDRPIEEYEKSFNTTVIYTHYSFSFPNEDCHLLLAGNYRVIVYADGNEEEPVAEACFSLLNPKMDISVNVSSNTDIDVNRSHQQVTYGLSYMNCNVIDPTRELNTIVMQNRRYDNAVVNLPPNIRKSNGAEWSHKRELIFPAGNEFLKFEILDVHQNGMGVDRIEWFDPYWHSTLLTASQPRNYTHDQDANGISLIRHSGDEDNDTQSEYLFVHFRYKSDPLPVTPYVCGLWTNGDVDEQCKMNYIEAEGIYETALLLKQGYYNWQPRVEGQTSMTEGNFYETENEYQILIYHRPQGARYDELVGYSIVNTK